MVVEPVEAAWEAVREVTLASKAWRLGAHLTARDGGPLEGLRYALEP